MAILSYAQVSINGTAHAPVAAAAGGDKVAPNERGALLVNNGGASAVTVTVATPGNTKYGQQIPDVAVSVAAGASRWVGPFPSDLADTDGLVAITYSAVTSVTVAPISI